MAEVRGKFLLIAMVLACMATTVEAQQMEVNDFKKAKRTWLKRLLGKAPSSDKQKAIIDLKTTEKGFTFTSNGKDAAEAEEGDGVITVKAPDKTRYLTIKHPQFGNLTWRVPVKYLKRKKHYRATLLASDPTKEYKPQQQWVVMTIEPKDAIVTMDSTVTLLTNGQYAAAIAPGQHKYKIEAPFFEEQADSFLLTDTARVELNIKLQPAYAYVTVQTPWKSGEIYIDGLYVDKGEGTSRRIQSGQHRLSVFLAETCVYDNMFSIGKAEKKNIVVTKQDFKVQPLKKTTPTMTGASQREISAKTAPDIQAPVTLKAADGNIRILVDREYVGTGQWNGKLSQGYHIINTMKDSIESKTTELWIVDSNPQEVNLAVPETSKALLNIHSNVIGADIYINKVHVGSTPTIVQQLPADRQYTVSLQKEGYKDTKVTVVPKGNEMTEVKIKMKRK